MTFGDSQTKAHIQAVLQMTPAQVTTGLTSVTVPTQLVHGARNGNTIPKDLLSLYNAIYTQSAYTYRI